MVDGLILEGKEEDFCVGCLYGKNHKKQIPWNELRKRLQLPRYRMHIKLCGPMQQTIKGGAHYFVFILFKDDAIGFKVISCIRSKIGVVVMACLKRFMAWLKHEIGEMLKILRSDKGSEFINVEFNSYLE